MRKTVLILISIFCITNSFSQNAIKLDVIPPASYLFSKVGFVDISYERQIKNKTYGAFGFNYGIFESGSDNEQLSGFAFFLEGRNYFKKNEIDELPKGFFYGAYLKEMITRYRYSNSPLQKGSIYGLGAIVGYKFRINKHFEIEPLFGLAYGISDIKTEYRFTGSPMQTALWRIELSIDYEFSGHKVKSEESPLNDKKH